MGMDDHYATLRVAPDADGGVIRSAYRDLMRRFHPDVNGSRGAGARAKAINEAYACLRDPSMRALYDRDRAAGITPPPRRGPAPSPCPEAAFTVADVGGWRRPRLGRPTWWHALGLGGATIVTAITFSATSAIPPNNAPGDITYVRVIEAKPLKAGEERVGVRARQTTE
ncbi:MAG: DnaJ domain-containing protein [Sphingomicrobium sp.]